MRDRGPAEVVLRCLDLRGSHATVRTNEGGSSARDEAISPFSVQAVEMTFWDIVRFLCLAYLLIAFLCVLWWIAGDVFRNDRASPVVKALWLLALLLMPFLTIFVYIIVNHAGMSARLAERERKKGYPGYSHASTSRPANQSLLSAPSTIG
jgi:hypothetical protein